MFVSACLNANRDAWADRFSSLLPRLPATANSLILMDVESIFSSPLAVKENWKGTYTKNFEASPLLIPPGARQFVLAADVEVESMTPLWEAAAMRMSSNPTAAQLAERLGGIADSVVGTQVVWPRSGLCVARFADYEFGLLMPASRHAAARWLRQGTPAAFAGFSPYLRKAARYAEQAQTEIIMAIDLGHILRPDEVRAAVRRSPLAKSLNEDPLVATLASIQGMTLGVRVTDHIHGKLIFDFGEDASILRPVGMPFVLQVLKNAGASLDEMADWTATVTGKRLSVEGPLTTAGMRRLFSLVALDATIINPETPADASPAPGPDRTAFASSGYFHVVSDYLADLQRSGSSTGDLSQIALWLNNYARKIDRIPSRGVDPELVQYGKMAANTLREAVAAIQGVHQQIAQRSSEIIPEGNVHVGAIPTGNTVNYGNEYYYRQYAPFATANIDIGAALRERQQISDEELQKGSEEGRKIFDSLKYQTEHIQQVMTDRYGKGFGQPGFRAPASDGP